MSTRHLRFALALILCFSVAWPAFLPAAHAADPVHITIGYYESVSGLGQFSTVMDAIIKEFTALYPHIAVSTSMTGYRAFYERLPVELASGVGPDVWLSDGVLIEQYSSQGYALDLTERIEQTMDVNDFFGVEDNRDPSGRIWAFPQGMQSSALFYNKDMFDKAGAAYPTADWTFDDVRSISRRLVVPDPEGGAPSQYGFRAANHITEGWYAVLRAFGGGALDASRRNSMFADARSVDALEFMTKMIFEDTSAPRPGIGGGIFNLFPQRFVAMQTALYNRTYAANESGINYDVTLMPQGPAGRFNPVIVNSWIINAQTTPQQQEAAWLWVKFFADERAQTMWAELGEAIPINRYVAIETFRQATAGPENVMVFVEGLAHSAPLDPNPVWSNWVDAATKALDQGFRGNISANEAAINAHRAVQGILDEYYSGD